MFCFTVKDHFIKVLNLSWCTLNLHLILTAIIDHAYVVSLNIEIPIASWMDQNPAHVNKDQMIKAVQLQ